MRAVLWLRPRSWLHSIVRRRSPLRCSAPALIAFDGSPVIARPVVFGLARDGGRPPLRVPTFVALFHATAERFRDALTPCVLDFGRGAAPGGRVGEFVLRPYQKECVDECLDLVEKGHTRQVVSLPVGTGKTVIMAEFMSRLQPRAPRANQVLVIAHREELLAQAMETVKQHLPHLSLEVEQGGFRASGSADVTFASVYTLGRRSSRRLEKFDPRRFKLIIVDEAHHAITLMYRRVWDHFGIFNGDSNVVVWGCTATVNRNDGVALDVFDKVAYHKDFTCMVDEHWLCGMRIAAVTTMLKLDEVEVRDGDYVGKQLSAAVNSKERNSLVVRAYRHFAEKQGTRKSTLCFSASVKHAQDLAAEFLEHGIDARVVFGATPPPQRRATVTAFKRGEFPVLVNYGVFTEGFDVPNVDCVLLTRPTKSRVLFTQMLGRGLRLFEGKQDCLFVDFVDGFDNALPTMPSLLGLKSDVYVEETSAGAKEMKRVSEKTLKVKVAAPREADNREREAMVEEFKDLREYYTSRRSKTGGGSVRLWAGHRSVQELIRSQSFFSWVYVTDDLFVLRLPGRGAEFNTIRLQRTSSRKWVASEFGASGPQTATPIPLQAEDICQAVKACDTWILTVHRHGWWLARKNANWRYTGASGSQLDILKSIGYSAAELSRLSKGAAADMITRASNGGMRPRGAGPAAFKPGREEPKAAAVAPAPPERAEWQRPPPRLRPSGETARPPPRP